MEFLRWEEKQHDCILVRMIQHFPGGPVVKNPPANAGVRGSIPGPDGFHMLQGN